MKTRHVWQLAALAIVAVIAACSGDDTKSSSDDGGADDDSDAGTSSGSDSGTQTTTLSRTYKSLCATCHGPEGRGQGSYPEIPGSLSQTAFIELVRSGRGSMPSFDASQISDAALKADYKWLTTQRN